MTAIEQLVAAVDAALASTGTLVMQFDDIASVPAEAQTAYVLDIDRIDVQNNCAGTTAPRDVVVTLRVTSFARSNALTSARRPVWVLAAAADAAITSDPTLGGILTVPMMLDAMVLDSELIGSRMAAVHARYSATIQVAWNNLDLRT